MSTEKQKPSENKAPDAKGKTAAAVPGKAKPVAAAPQPAPPPPKLFRTIDWISFGVTTLLVFIGYYLTLTPNLTLEDAGELATGSFYAGVPHPPGYPVWTIYTWFFTQFLPFSNIAWRVAVSSAVAGAVACGVIALLVSRGCSLILEGIDTFKDIERRWENALCVVAGYVSGMLLGFNGFMWSQAVIVEVYTLSVLSLMGVLGSLLRWYYAPAQRKYLYWAAFWFGICFTNHQTLICAAMGIEIAVMTREPRLGRDLFFVNSAFYLLGLMWMAAGGLISIKNNHMLFVIYNVVGVLSIIGCSWLTINTQKLLTEWKPTIITVLLGLLGASFYLYMPLASMSNPPMNWGYPRTVEGFFHALSRGQYESTHPTSEWTRLIEQVDMLKDGAIDEFGIVYLFIALVPFLFIRRMNQRDRAWMIGLSAIYFCLAFLLLILLSPSPDKQSRDLTKVFFTASHVMISMWIGYGLALIGAMILTQYERCRYWLIGSAAIACGFALYTVVVVWGPEEPESVALSNPFFNAILNLVKLKVDPSQYWLVRYTVVWALVIVGLYTLLLVIMPLFQNVKRQVFLGCFLVLFACIPSQSVFLHWADNEQRGHMFGYWFGHDMFTPPFNGSDNKPLYPEMTKDAVLFGGTDPGRFCPTYMIFCESFIPPSAKQDTDPKFDRRDVYIITQNALADATYLMYIRAHYNRSTQKDPPFFKELLGKFGPISKLAEFMLDKPFTAFGASIEARRRREGVYPPNEIHTPGPDDSQRAFEEYVNDANKRLNHDMQFPNEPKQIRPGEDVHIQDNKIQVSGQIAVMAINGLLTKDIFDKNPTHEFFVEESFPLDWMYPYLTPFGIIMKINRQQIPEMTQEMVDRDHSFWSQYSGRMIGNWITYDTPVSNICAFAEKVYKRHDYSDFKGDPAFIRDNDAQKAFSKLRSALAGLYSWRINATVGRAAEQNRMVKEADFAFRQSFAFCPYSPEAVFRYTNLLLSLQRVDDALMVARTFKLLDPNNPSAQSLIDQLTEMKQRQSGAAVMQNQLGLYEQQFQADPTNLQIAYTLFTAYMQSKQTNRAARVVDMLMNSPKADANSLANAANWYSQIPDLNKMEMAMTKLVMLNQQNPEAWYDLSAIQAAGGKMPASLQSLKRAIDLSDARLPKEPKANNLRAMAPNDPRFGGLRETPEFKAIFAPQK